VAVPQGLRCPWGVPAVGERFRLWAVRVFHVAQGSEGCPGEARFPFVLEF